MGYFGTFLFDGRSWAEAPPDGIVPPAAEFWLHVDIHDSDFTVVTYRPAGPGTGVAYLGYTPRTYFENPEASPPTDARREAAGLADWWAGRQGGAPEADREAMAAGLLPYLAEDLGADDDLDDEEEERQLDDADVFVEVKTNRFLAALGLPPLD